MSEQQHYSTDYNNHLYGDSNTQDSQKTNENYQNIPNPGQVPGLQQIASSYAPPMTSSAPSSSLYSNNNPLVVGNGRYNNGNTNDSSYFLNSNNSLDALNFNSQSTQTSQTTQSIMQQGTSLASLEQLIKVNFESVIFMISELNKRVNGLESKMNDIQNTLSDIQHHRDHHQSAVSSQENSPNQSEDPEKHRKNNGSNIHTLNEPPPPSSLPQQSNNQFKPPFMVQPMPGGTSPTGQFVQSQQVPFQQGPPIYNPQGFQAYQNTRIQVPPGAAYPPMGYPPSMPQRNGYPNQQIPYPANQYPYFPPPAVPQKN